MHTTNLRKVGGSVMLAVPPAILDLLRLRAGTTVGVAVADGCLIVEPHPRLRYTMEELLAQCLSSTETDATTESDATTEAEDRIWLDGPAAGRELI